MGAFATSTQMPFQTHPVACEKKQSKTADKYANFHLVDFETEKVLESSSMSVTLTRLFGFTVPKS